MLPTRRRAGCCLYLVYLGWGVSPARFYETLPLLYGFLTGLALPQPGEKVRPLAFLSSLLLLELRCGLGGASLTGLALRKIAVPYQVEL